MNRRRGFSLIELMFSVAILGLVFLAASHMNAPVLSFFQNSQSRQKANSEARACLYMISTAMKGGLANSVHISTPVTVPVVPNSRIDFFLAAPLASGTTAYAFYLANRAVLVQEYPGGAGVQLGKQLATNVSGLMFTGDYRDPSIVYVSLRIDAPLDSSGRADRVTTIQVADQEIHMLLNH
jgi:prepilin-type N-terminal cleavage/methylation domain-containing protein